MTWSRREIALLYSLQTLDEQSHCLLGLGFARA
jgi:hypothetical protein